MKLSCNECEAEIEIGNANPNLLWLEHQNGEPWGEKYPEMFEGLSLWQRWKNRKLRDHSTVQHFMHVIEEEYASKERTPA